MNYKQNLCFTTQACFTYSKRGQCPWEMHQHTSCSVFPRILRLFFSDVQDLFTKRHLPGIQLQNLYTCIINFNSRSLRFMKLWDISDMPSNRKLLIRSVDKRRRTKTQDSDWKDCPAMFVSLHTNKIKGHVWILINASIPLFTKTHVVLTCQIANARA